MSLTERLAAEAAKGQRVKPAARILTLDIENAPSTAAVWQLYQQSVNLGQILTEGRILGVGLKWLDQPAPFWVDERRGRDHMLRVTWEAMSNADIVVGYNSNGFDIKHLNWEFAQAGLGRPKPFKSIDLYRVVRANFRPLSKKLDHVASHLGLGNKIDTGGLDLWLRCMDGDPEAWRQMARYCRRDVVLTEQLYLHLLQWLPGSAHVGLMIGKERGCANCGCEDLAKRGTTNASLIKYALYRCTNCDTWLRTNYVHSRAVIRPAR